MRRILFASAVLLLLVATSAMAHPRCVETVLRNPDARTSIALTAGIGDTDKGAQNGDLSVFGAALTYPATKNVSFLAAWNHSELDWNSITRNTDTNLFTIGLKFYLP